MTGRLSGGGAQSSTNAWSGRPQLGPSSGLSPSHVPLVTGLGGGLALQSCVGGAPPLPPLAPSPISLQPLHSPTLVPKQRTPVAPAKACSAARNNVGVGGAISCTGQTYAQQNGTPGPEGLPQVQCRFHPKNAIQPPLHRPATLPVCSDGLVFGCSQAAPALLYPRGYQIKWEQAITSCRDPLPPGGGWVGGWVGQSLSGLWKWIPRDFVGRVCDMGDSDWDAMPTDAKCVFYSQRWLLVPRCPCEGCWAMPRWACSGRPDAWSKTC